MTKKAGIRYTCFNCNKPVMRGESHTFDECIEYYKARIRKERRGACHITVAAGIFWFITVVVFILWLREIS